MIWKKVTVILFAAFLLLAIILVLRPCANGQTIIAVNTLAEDVHVNIYDEDWHNIIYTMRVPSRAGLIKKRAYITGTQSYNIQVTNSDKTKVIMRADFLGYIATPGTQTAFFLIDKNGINFTDWSPKSSLLHFAAIGADALSCTDAYLLGFVEDIY